MDQQSVEKAVLEIERDGVVLLPAFCEAAFLENVFGVAKSRIRRVTEALGEQEIGIGSAAGFDEIVQRSPGRWDIPITPGEFGFETMRLPWSQLVAAVLGADAEHSFSGIVFSEPGSPAQCWHTDSPHLAADHRPAHALNVLVALHDVPMDMGPTEFARGSHRLTNHRANPSLVVDELIYQHAATTPELLVRGTGTPAPTSIVDAFEAGSCLVFDDRIMHRGLGNDSARTRYVAYFSYRRKGYAENTHFESQRSVFDGAA